MSEVFVYVEGPSDQLGMRELLADMMAEAENRGSSLDFYPLGGKDALLQKGPGKALNILRNRPNSWVFLVPDLYPGNKSFDHESYEELKSELCRRFKTLRDTKKCNCRFDDRFFVHCFKYDLESLLLASEDVLLSRLGKRRFSLSWKRPVEDQNHTNPPKRIVESLFEDAGLRYKGTSDVPWILSRSNLQDLMAGCSQNFKPFIEDLRRVLGVDV
ncbi:MAG: hypothetical protein DRP66_01485 [Planctomycetota bacterium]|nr:MAG: hypothetical protein DRP66_01485 [Planctomycetota bacterium]